MKLQEKPLHKQIRRIPWIFLFIVLSGTILSVCETFYSVGKTRILNVEVRGLKEKTIRHIEVDGKLFSSGYEGKLYWKVKNVKEAFLTSLVNQTSPVNFYDLFYFWVLDIVLFIMVYGINENTIFSEQISTGLKLIAYSIISYPFILIVSNYVSEWSIKELTDHQFTSQYRNLSIVKYLYVTCLVIFFIPFVKKAINLQKEQNLTI